MRNFIVAGQGTDVGKTVVAAILATLMNAEYWKPIQCGCGEESDSERIRMLLDPEKQLVHPPVYALKALLSPHHAARLEGISIDPDSISLPKTDRPLIIEMCGGILVPLTMEKLCINLFKKWSAEWILVSRHYIGSINHTLLTLEALKQRGIRLAGVVFNGEPNPDSEAAILFHAQAPCLARVLPEKNINKPLIQRYAEEWRYQLSSRFHL